MKNHFLQQYGMALWIESLKKMMKNKKFPEFFYSGRAYFNLYGYRESLKKLRLECQNIKWIKQLE